jgi:DNA helicase-2/ATP-dependent DNA helicase PcrA
MTTFTASDVRLFRRFKQRPDVVVMPLAVSGRSALPIIKLANDLVRWARREHPEPWVREHALSDDVLIHPTPPDDPQQNPTEGDIRLRAFSDEENEAETVANSAVDFILRHPECTCAILAPTNAFGQRVVQRCRSARRAIQMWRSTRINCAIPSQCAGWRALWPTRCAFVASRPTPKQRQFGFTRA